MSSPIDSLGVGSPGVPRQRKTAAQLVDELEGIPSPDGTLLPVPVSSARTIPPNRPAANGAAIQAQMDGARRGLRGGASVIDEARATYNRTEWSGSQDRRPPKGHARKTEV
jgi:hypothetical protein